MKTPYSLVIKAGQPQIEYNGEILPSTSISTIEEVPELKSKGIAKVTMTVLAKLTDTKNP